MQAFTILFVTLPVVAIAIVVTVLMTPIKTKQVPQKTYPKIVNLLLSTE